MYFFKMYSSALDCTCTAAVSRRPPDVRASSVVVVARALCAPRARRRRGVAGMRPSRRRA
eukprot:COSAG02_NODE_23469_length_717_cov_2.669903_1_plen_59_part_10